MTTIRSTFILLSLVIVSFAFQSCSNKQSSIESISVSDQIHPFHLSEVRLGDGVAVDLDLSIRWNIPDSKSFFASFETLDTFQEMILFPRTLEISRQVSNQFQSVDAVFSDQRDEFIEAIKVAMLSDLGKAEADIKEVIVSSIKFPKSYTHAMEQVGLQQQELERISQQKVVDLAKAEADKSRAEANGKVAIAEAEANGRLQKIQAETEKNRRQSELARAETQSQVQKLQAKAEAERKKLLAEAEVHKMRQIKNLDVEKKRELNLAELDNQRDLEKMAFENQLEFAKLCTDNPVYASFLVNKELASKVEIAVLPTGSDPTVFGNILNQTMNKNK